MMWWSRSSDARYGSGRSNDSNGPTNLRWSSRNVLAALKSPLPSAFWNPFTTSFALVMLPHFSCGRFGASCQQVMIGPPGIRNQKKLPIPGTSTRGKTTSAPAALTREGDVEIGHPHVVRAVRPLLRLRRPDSAPAARRRETHVLPAEHLHALERPAEDLLQETSCCLGV